MKFDAPGHMYRTGDSNIPLCAKHLQDKNQILGYCYKTYFYFVQKNHTLKANLPCHFKI